MGFFERLAFGWRLGMTSLGVVAKDKTLMLFPILSGISGLLLLAAFVLGIGPENLAAVKQGQVTDLDQVPALYMVLSFLAYFALAFVAVYFNVALIAAAQQSLNGKDTVLADGLSVANANVGKIAGWALLSGTVGLVLNILENENRIGSLIRKILGAAWAVITYFAVPVMIFENQSPTGAIGRSITLMKGTWGENAGAQAGIGLVGFVMMVGVVIVGVGGTILVPQLGVVLVPAMILAIPVIILLSMAAKAVLTVGLYQYATKGGGGTGAFAPEQLRAAFAPR